MALRVNFFLPGHREKLCNHTSTVRSDEQIEREWAVSRFWGAAALGGAPCGPLGPAIDMHYLVVMLCNWLRSLTPP